MKKTNGYITTNELIDLYSVFLDDYLTSGSSNSYISYLKNAFKKLTDSDFQNNVGKKSLELIACSNYKTRLKIVDCLKTMLYKESQKDNPTINKKTISNYLSSVNKFYIFLEFSKNKWSGATTPKGVFKGMKINSIYSKDDLIEAFRFRLETQDRYYANISFPCRLFSKIYKNNSDVRLKNEYNDMLEGKIKETKIIYSDKGDSIRLDSVECIVIKGTKSIMKSGGKNYTIFTEKYDKDTKGGIFVESKATSLSELSLDHDEALHNILTCNITNYPIIKRISDELAKTKNNTPKEMSSSKLLSDFFEKEYSKMFIDETALLAEIKNVFGEIGLTIMDVRNNSSKNKN